MDVAGPVLQPQDVAGLGDVGEQRIVAGVLPMMGIEAAEGPADGGAGADHGAIDVDRQPRQRQARDGVDHEVVVELDQRRQRLLRELPEPVAHGARRRHARQPAEARDQRIAGEVPQVLQPARADVEQRQHQQGEPAAAVVARPSPHTRPAAGAADRAAAGSGAAVPARRTRSAPGARTRRQIPLDHPAQARYAQSHQRGLLCEGSDMGMSSLKSAQGAFLFLGINVPLPQLFSDWG